MATKKRKKTTKRTSKTTSKKSLEAKIAELEAKLSSISSQTGGTAEQAPPPPPKPAEQAPPPPPKPAEQAPPPPPKPAEQAPKPAEEKAAPPATLAQALEDAWQNYAMTNTHDYKTKTPGFTPGPNRYYARRSALVGNVATTDWNLQKLKGTTPVPSNQYFATRARLAYHPADRTFTGYGLEVEGATAQTQQAPPPPPPQPEPQPQQTTASTGGGSKKSDLEAYEADYMARLEQQERENAELMKAAAELAAKRSGESGGSSGQASSKKGALPKGS